MKSYYQSENGGFRLSKENYKIHIARIRAYQEKLEKIEHIENKAEIDIKEEDIANKVWLEREVRIIREALTNYVREEYRMACFTYLCSGGHYTREDVAFMHNISVSSLRRYLQRWAYGVAVLSGEDY